jgi:hypothetical protein
VALARRRGGAAAIDSGDVPAALAGELRGAAERLLGLIPNAAPAPPAKPDEGKPEKHEKKPKKPKKPKPGEETDTTGTTEPTDTTGTTTEGG